MSHGSQLLSPRQVEEQLAGLPQWKLDGGAITRQLVFRNFREAIAFLTLIAFDAEEADHHPDVTIQYKRLNLSLSTHSAGGLTEKDFALAKKIDEAFRNGLGKAPA
jgi:4a-hydroxytetrahydrobiopterin dehydratase